MLPLSLIRHEEVAHGSSRGPLAPILISAVIVFIASSIMHTVLPYHRSDYRQLPDEDKLLAVLRGAGLTRGLYIFPFGTHKDMKTPAMQEKYKQGPVGMMTVFPNGPVAMPKFLAQWFGYCLIVAFFVAYLTGHTVAPGTPYLAVFRVAGTVAFMAYGLGQAQQRHLEGPDLEHDHQGSDRRLCVRLADRRDVRVALASLSCSF